MMKLMMMVVSDFALLLCFASFRQVMQDTNQELMQTLSISSFPTFRFYLEGSQVDETKGANIQEVASKVRTDRSIYWLEED